MLSDRVDNENNRSQPCGVLAVKDDYGDQSCANSEDNKIFNNIDEKNRELAKLIKKKSESLIQFIKSVTKSSTSYQPNEK